MNSYNLNVSISKAHSNGGEWRIHGVASDASIDMQNEIVDPAGITSLPYLIKWGKFNDDHTRTYLGEVTEAKVLRKGQLVENGVIDHCDPSEADNKVLYVAGTLYKNEPRAQHYWNILQSGGRLGFSIQGTHLQKAVGAGKNKDGQPVDVISRCFINQIAITAQPVNPNVFAIAKSRHAAALFDAICKALTTGDDAVAPGDSGGCGMRRQSLEGAKKRRKKTMKTAYFDTGALNTPEKIVKAWREDMPNVAKGLDADELTGLAAGMIEASKAHGLTYAMTSDAEEGTDFCKSLSEADYQILNYLENAEPNDIADIMAKSISGNIDEGETEDDDDDDSEDSGEDDEDEDEDDRSNDDYRKSGKKSPIPPVKKSLAQALSEDPKAAGAMDVSEFLESFVHTISKSLGDQQATIENLPRACAEAIAGPLEKLANGMDAVLEALNGVNKSFEQTRQEIDQISRKPQSPGHYNVVNKTFSVGAQSDGMAKSRAVMVLEKAAINGLVRPELVIQYETNPGSVSDNVLRSLEATLIADNKI